jgi:hypothetical protein
MSVLIPKTQYLALNTYSVALRKVFSSNDFPKPAVHQRFGMPCNYVALKLKKLQWGTMPKPTSFYIYG